MRCFNCEILGHYAAECQKSRRDKTSKPEVNLTQVNDDEPALLMAKCGDEKGESVVLNEGRVHPGFGQGTECENETDVWYLDNGASNHMTGQRSKFKELNEGVTGRVKFGDGSTVNIEGKGSVAFICKNGEEKILQEVYFIPTLRNNIISLGQLSEKGNKVVLNREFLWVYENDGRLLMKVTRSSNRLYKICIKENRVVCLLTKAEEVAWLWHSRLGHVNFQAMQYMCNNEMAHGLPNLIHPK